MATAVAPDLHIPTLELTIDEIDTLTAAGPGTLLVLIGPALAKILLKRNRKNRSQREATVGDYLRDIQSGTWGLNGETIKFARTGDLLDVQHRLEVIVKASVAMETFIVVGPAPETQATMDAGRPPCTAIPPPRRRNGWKRCRGRGRRHRPRLCGEHSVQHVSQLTLSPSDLVWQLQAWMVAQACS
ncbi:hypothetical protein ACFV2N_18110 [Streptomyces sp. NPDC059680]|uniref:hypothetical protein n=1 Tax=Streptomyces sp. NPDC059680 TaxID=3346904 RepID=UPI00369C2334